MRSCAAWRTASSNVVLLRTDAPLGSQATRRLRRGADRFPSRPTSATWDRPGSGEHRLGQQSHAGRAYLPGPRGSEAASASKFVYSAATPVLSRSRVTAGATRAQDPATHSQS